MGGRATKTRKQEGETGEGWVMRNESQGEREEMREQEKETTAAAPAAGHISTARDELKWHNCSTFASTHNKNNTKLQDTISIRCLVIAIHLAGA